MASSPLADKPDHRERLHAKSPHNCNRSHDAGLADAPARHNSRGCRDHCPAESRTSRQVQSVSSNLVRASQARSIPANPAARTSLVIHGRTGLLRCHHHRIVHALVGTSEQGKLTAYSVFSALKFGTSATKYDSVTHKISVNQLLRNGNGAGGKLLGA